MSTGLTFRAITPDELEAYRNCVVDVFGFDSADDPYALDRLRALNDPARSYCAFDGAALVATAGAYPFTYSVPGGQVAMAGLTQVTVRSTHRRRGILRTLIAAHLADAAAHGEPVSGLWASDAGIYGRFGYGVAAEADELTITPDAGFARPPAGGFDDLAALDVATATAELPPIYARVMAVRPGMFSRSAAWWHHRRFLDRADQRKGRSPRRHLVCRRGGTATGYVVYRQNLEFDAGGRPAGALDLEELVAVDATAEATLWHHVTTVDLFPKVSWWNAPVDSLATWRAADRRNVMRVRRGDTVWLNILEPGRALTARRYAAGGTLRLSVAGSGVTWELGVDDGGAAQCRRVSGAPDIELDPPALGSIYLGGYAPSLLARSGAIRGSAEALARADQIFVWPAAAPWCAEIF